MAAQQALVPVDEPQALAEADASVSMFERLARDPSVDVEKLERLIAMQERIMRHNAKAAFDAAFAKLQRAIPVIDEKGRIEVKGSLRSTYAQLEDIHAVIKPICAEHGFAIRHRTEWPEDRKGIIRIVGILSHEQGHSEESVFEAPMDKSDFRTDIQSMGSTVSYGRRYTTMDLLNIATKRADTDGRGAQQQAPKPDGYDEWAADMEAHSAAGLPAVTKAFSDSKPEFKTYALNQGRQWWSGVKTKAAQVKGGQR